MQMGSISARSAKVNKIIGRGAEAILYLEDGKLVKERIKKNYRIDVIDARLRSGRTKREAKILEKKFSFVPTVYETDTTSMKIVMDYIEGNLLRDTLGELENNELDRCMVLIGKHIGELHAKDVIHGDITTSNLIIKKNDVYFIDFGLSFVSTKAEDRAVDLHLFRQALESTHHAFAERCFKNVLEGYRTYAKSSDVLKRLEKVEKRGRYKRKMLVE